MNTEKRTFENQLERLEYLCKKLEINAPKCVDPASVSTKAKIPFKALALREIIYLRTLELCLASLDLYKQKKYPIAAFLCSRAVLETCAVSLYAYLLVQDVVNKKSIGDIDEKLMTLLLRGRKGYTSYKSINILTIVQKINKLVPNYSDMYEILSEYSHPNWSGCHNAYANIDKENIKLDLTGSSEKLNMEVGLFTLVGTIELYKYYYNKLGKILDPFSLICEAELEKILRNNSVQ